MQNITAVCLSLLLVFACNLGIGLVEVEVKSFLHVYYGYAVYRMRVSVIVVYYISGVFSA